MFWNVITYFLIYELPINTKYFLEDQCDLIIEECIENRCFNFLKLPALKYIN